MNVGRVGQWCLLTGLVALVTGLSCDGAWGAQPGPPPAAEEGVQVLTRGPVHEAFAETVMFDPEAGVVVPKAPPAAIEELPPDQRLEGANVAWIPGYWAWDDERSDFLWVSGVWRNLPPGRQWVPGYWGQSGTGFQWTSGYWADATVSEVEYLPEPPATVEVGPNNAAPSADQTWLPGCWVWQQNRYAWRPGFWAPVQPNWLWVPSYYVWAPRGYVYVNGYWDYSIARRGVLFAPVYFDSGVYSRRGFSYSPATVIDLALFTEHLFLRPQYHHYYFGDYYAASYSNRGFYPWYSFHNQHGYDPIYAHQRWEHRQDSGWEQNIAATFQNRRVHEEARPPRTWAAQSALTARGVNPAVQNLVVAKSFNQLTKNKEGATLGFQAVNKEERQTLAKHGQDVQKFREARQRLEATAAAKPGEKPVQQLAPTLLKIPNSPITARSPVQLGKDLAPPKAHQVPQPDPQVQPKPRVKRSPEQPRTQPPPQPKVERQQPQPRAERSAPRPRDNKPEGPPAGGGQREQHKGKGKG
jgi:hypothetical protein